MSTLVVAATMVVSACSSGNSGDSEKPAGSASSAASASSSNEKITLRMIDSLASPERTSVLEQLLDKFEQENPNVTVELISPPLEGADQKIATMLMTKQPLDIVDSGNASQAMVNNEWIQPLNKYFEGWDEYSTLSEGALNRMNAVDPSKVYYIPYGLYQKLIFYRKDWFEAAGLQPPTTWQELYDVGLKLMDPNNNRYGWSFRGGSNGYQYYYQLLASYIGDSNIENMENGYFLKDGRTIFGTPEAKEALEFYKKLYTDISPKDSISWGFTEMVQGFMGGTTAMLLQDPDVIASVQDGMEEGTWGVTPLPLGPSGQGSLITGSAGWAMTSYTEHPEMAAKLILFLSNNENNTIFAKATGLIPIHTSAREDEYFNSGPYAVFSEMASMKGKYTYAQMNQGYAAGAEFMATNDEWMQKYLLNQISADELLAKWDKFWLDALAAEGKVWEK